MPRVIVCTHDSGEYSFDAPDSGWASGWAQRGPIDLPQELIDAYENALKAKRKAGAAIDARLRADDLD